MCPNPLGSCQTGAPPFPYLVACGSCSVLAITFGIAIRLMQYSLDGKVFDFHGTLRMQAKLSQMTKGWKSILLKPIDPFFHKEGAGTQVPFKITGTRSEPHFGLDFHRNESPKTDSEVNKQPQPVHR